MNQNPNMAFSQNRLLAVLPHETVSRWLPHIEEFEMYAGQVLYDSGVHIDHVYFPTTAVVSLICLLEDGSSTDIGVVGNEGLVGISLFMGGGSTPSRAIVQIAGHGFRLNAATLLAEFERSGPALHLLLRYTQALITQMTQTAVCNRHHSPDQQFCRWLLMTLDRVNGDELRMTQRLIANSLGIRRESIVKTAGNLQKDGIIEYARGVIRVLDRPRMEVRCCECYKVVQDEFERLLPDKQAT